MASNDKGLEEIPEGVQNSLVDIILPTSFLRPRCNLGNAILYLCKTDAAQRIGQIESNYDEVTDSFDSMNLKSELLRGK